MPEPKKQRMQCDACGHEFIGSDSKCPSCGELTAKAMPEGEDTLRKTFDPPDMKKGLS